MAERKYQNQSKEKESRCTNRQRKSCQKLAPQKLSRVPAAHLVLGRSSSRFPSAAFQGQTWRPGGKVRDPKLTIAKIKGDLYEVRGGGGNVAGLRYRRRASRSSTPRIMVRSFTTRLCLRSAPLPISRRKYLINTHDHADHIGGNVHFADTAQIVQHVEWGEVYRQSHGDPQASLQRRNRRRVFRGRHSFTHEQVVITGGTGKCGRATRQRVIRMAMRLSFSRGRSGLFTPAT